MLIPRKVGKKTFANKQLHNDDNVSCASVRGQIKFFFRFFLLSQPRSPSRRSLSLNFNLPNINFLNRKVFFSLRLFFTIHSSASIRPEHPTFATSIKADREMLGKKFFFTAEENSRRRVNEKWWKFFKFHKLFFAQLIKRELASDDGKESVQSIANEIWRGERKLMPVDVGYSIWGFLRMKVLACVCFKLTSNNTRLSRFYPSRNFLQTILK